MSKVLRCRDVGVHCDFEAKGETDEEILARARDHAAQAHGVTHVSPEMAGKLRAAIRGESQQRSPSCGCA